MYFSATVALSATKTGLHIFYLPRSFNETLSRCCTCLHCKCFSLQPETAYTSVQNTILLYMPFKSAACIKL